MRSPEGVRRVVRAARAARQEIGFVPTMGFLHEGHLSLVRRARRENGLLVASLFVNPLQFGPKEDYAAYPRTPRRDHALLRSVGVDLCFEPRADAFYPASFSTQVWVRRLEDPLCGRFRPGHFVGVATVVTKLLASVEPDRLYLGLKDYQQTLVLRRLIRDLNLGVRAVLCPTVREADGLAMSSRNSYLTPEERAWAPRLYRTLRSVAAEVRAGRWRAPEPVARAVDRALRGGPGRLQYVEILGADDLEPRRPLRGRMVLALAYVLGKARLIDNVLLTVPEGTPRPGPARGLSRSRREAATVPARRGPAPGRRIRG